MKEKIAVQKSSRKKYSSEFKDRAMSLSDKVGVSQAAEDLDIPSAMLFHGILSKFKATTNSNHSLPVAPNLLGQNFEAKHPNEKWLSDITYIPTDEGWIYLAAVMDLYSKMIIGWSLSERMTSNIVVDALKMALGKRNKPKEVIIHSDRGS